MRVDGFSGVNMLSAPQGTNTAESKLTQGDVVVAEVVQTKGEQVLLRLENGEVIKALMQDDVPLSKGDMATLLVTKNTDSQLMMQVLNVSDRNQAALSPNARLVARMGFEINNENLQLMNLFTQLKLPVRPELFERAIALRQQMPLLEPALTVFFAANQIDVNEQVLSSMKALLSGMRTGDELSKLAEDIDGALAALRQDGVMEQNMQPAQSSRISILREVQDWLGSETQGAQQAQGAAGQPEKAHMGETVLDVARALAQADPAAAKAMGGEQRIAEQLVRLLNTPDGRQTAAKEEIASIMEKFSGLDALNKTVLTVKLESLLNTPATQTVAAKAQMPDINEARQALGAVLSKIQDVFIQLDDKADGKTFKAEMETLPQRLAAMQNEMQLSVSGKNAMMRQAGEVLAQNRLHSDISSCTYMQIPVQIQHRQQTAELFVLKRNNGQKRIDPENATILVALETEQMGRVETLIKVEGKGVALQFRMSDEQVMSLFRNETADMHRRLQEAGYRLTDMRCTKLEEPVTPVTFAAMADELPKSMHRVDVTA